MTRPGICALADLSVGNRALVIRISGSDDVTMRLLEMGLTPGVEVLMAGKAPLGDPLELVVRGYRLSIRKSEAARVETELCA
ncbi:MAG TPA: ferrous iron transport protein A [Pirellulales bacterium]|nr:ferrous iron transport protein A [Pirellulales bacterium]